MIDTVIAKLITVLLLALIAWPFLWLAGYGAGLGMPFWWYPVATVSVGMLSWVVRVGALKQE